MYFYILSLLLWLLYTPLFSAQHTSLANQPPSVVAQAAPSTFVNGTVNAIDGNFCYAFHCLTVPGAVPLDLMQYYNSKSSYSSWLGRGMSLNYSFWIAGKEYSEKPDDKYDKYAAVLAEAEGGSIIRCFAKCDP